MKLLLTSNGLTSPELEEAYDDLIGERKGLKMAMIPTAGDPIEWVPENESDPDSQKVARLTKETHYVKNDQSRFFEEKGFEVKFVDLKDDKDEVRKELEEVDVILVGGGDANWLLDWAKKAELGTYLQELLDKGVAYVGESAGNGLLQHDIGLSWWDPSWNLDHVAFGIIDFCVAVHQDPNDMSGNIEKIKKNRERIEQYIKFPWKVYLLADGQAIKVDGGKVEHIGPGEKNFV